jgi:pimeloyl-ACP methyl ester carboxylesterase
LDVCVAGRWWGRKESGRILLGLHDLGEDSSSWEGVSTYLSERTSLLSLDLPGCGESSRLPEGCTYNQTDLVLGVRRWKRGLGLEGRRVVALGRGDLGSELAFLYGSLYPEEVVNVVCLGDPPTGYSDPDEAIQEMASRIDSLLRVPPSRPDPRLLLGPVDLYTTRQILSLPSPPALHVLPNLPNPDLASIIERISLS